MGKLINVVNTAEANTLPDDQKKPPDNVTGACTKCGKCCVLWGCPLVDPITHQCPIYTNRPVACRMYPRRQTDIDNAACPGFTQTGL